MSARQALPAPFPCSPAEADKIQQFRIAPDPYGCHWADCPHGRDCVHADLPEGDA